MKINTDISALLDTSTRHTVAITRDDKGEVVLGLVVVGSDSQEFQQIAAEVKADGLRANSARKKMIDVSTPEGSAEWAALQTENEIRIATAVVMDWVGFTQNGVPITFDREQVRQMMRVRPSWREAVTNAVDNHANFLPKLADS